jgi:hypothetical protein
MESGKIKHAPSQMKLLDLTSDIVAQDHRSVADNLYISAEIHGF